MTYTIVTPLNNRQTNQATLYAQWFIQDTEYPPRKATFTPLVNGETCFSAVYRAIAAAKKTVDIICWGFQPSMYFIRNGKGLHPPTNNNTAHFIPPGGNLCIGALLEKKAKEGVKIRVLCWALEPINVNVTGATGEPNTPGKNRVRISAQPSTSKAAHYQYDTEWYSRHQRTNIVNDINSMSYKDIIPAPIPNPISIPKDKNLHFIVRGFSRLDRAKILAHAAEHSDETARTTKLTLTAFPTHHQKTVLVDYELPDAAVGFVMGHNMLDEYWDNNQHSRLRHLPAKGRNSKNPRQDISCRLTGPILEHIHENFATAWAKETDENLLQSRQAMTVAKKLYFRPAFGTPLMAQILRTQTQENKRHIQTLYLNAVNNATSYIYIENQYFRWQALADAILKAAKKQIGGGRDPARHGSLHLFVVTNDTDDGIGDGTASTYDMLSALGRADVMPGIARLKKTDDLRARWLHADNQVRRDEINLLSLKLVSNSQPLPARDKQLAIIAASKAKRDALARELKDMEQGNTRILPEPRPGLKIHVCTLVAPDSQPEIPDRKYVRMKYPMSAEAVTIPGRKWLPVYVHSKLMIVDDVFTTLGSANINIRSMQVDSEINVAHEHGELSRTLRQDLWSLHTNGKGAQLAVNEAFNEWSEIIKDNKKARSHGKAPIASLVEFHRTSPDLSYRD